MNQQEIARKKRVMHVGIWLILICVCVILYSLHTGSIRLSPYEVLRTLVGLGSEDDSLVLFEYRLPRIVITILAGMGLGISGAILQGLYRNSLADPGVLGIHAGAAFGLIVFVSFFRSLEGMISLVLPLFTFAGAVLVAVLIVLLAYDRHKGVLPIRLILVGIALAAGFSAITLFLSLRLDEGTYAFAARWLAGNVWGREWANVLALLPWIILLIPYAWLQSKVLDALLLGDEVATSIGAPVQRKRFLLMGTAVALASVSVSMAGGVGFIGLAAPHLARRLVGPLHQYMLPIAGLIGVVILVAADTIGRSIFQPNAIPAGVVVAAVGAPYFLYLLAKTK